MKKPEYDRWAEALLIEIKAAPDSHKQSIVKEHLYKAVKRGFLDGLENGWWKEQEELGPEFSKHLADWDLYEEVESTDRKNLIDWDERTNANKVIPTRGKF